MTQSPNEVCKLERKKFVSRAGEIKKIHCQWIRNRGIFHVGLKQAPQFCLQENYLFQSINYSVYCKLEVAVAIFAAKTTKKEVLRKYEAFYCSVTET